MDRVAPISMFDGDSGADSVLVGCATLFAFRTGEDGAFRVHRDPVLKYFSTES